MSKLLVRSLLVAAIWVGLGASPASAGYIYEFSTPANGEVGSFHIKLALQSLTISPGLSVIPLSAPEVTVISAPTGIDLAESALGIDVGLTDTLIGFVLFDSEFSLVATTLIYADDFFMFIRESEELGIFGSLGGFVYSDFEIETANPPATLTVSEEALPEPHTGLLMGIGLSVIFVRKIRRSRPRL